MTKTAANTGATLNVADRFLELHSVVEPEVWMSDPVAVGDWVVQHEDGHLFKVSNEEFRRTYRPASFTVHHE